MHFDVVVAGAGPAGSVTAYQLARAGIRVLLLESHNAVGTPVHCSGLVTPRTLDLAGVGSSTVRHHIYGAIVHSHLGSVLRLGDSRLRALVIDRLAFDVQLADRAVAHGAELWLGHRLDCIERDGTSLRLAISMSRGVRTITTTLLVGADGAGSRVARFLGQHTNIDRIRAMGAVIALGHERDSEHVRVFLGDKIAPKWFAWLIPTGSGQARIGVGAPMYLARSPKDLLANVLSHFQCEFEGARVLELSAGTIPLYRPMQTYGDNVMLVGDAARQVKPLSGGGIRAALVGGQYCAQTAQEALSMGDASARVLRRYQQRWHKDLRPEFERARRLRQVAHRLGDGELNQLLGLLSQPLLRDIIHRHGDIDFPGRLFSFAVRDRTFRQALPDIPLASS